MARNPNWSREELILALDLYRDQGSLPVQHPEVRQLSDLLRKMSGSATMPDPKRFRNPSGVAMKLRNFASIDPHHRGKALFQVGRGDREVWDEFATDRERLRKEAERIRESQAATLARSP